MQEWRKYAFRQLMRSIHPIFHNLMIVTSGLGSGAPDVIAFTLAEMVNKEQNYDHLKLEEKKQQKEGKKKTFPTTQYQTNVNGRHRLTLSSLRVPLSSRSFDRQLVTYFNDIP